MSTAQISVQLLLTCAVDGRREKTVHRGEHSGGSCRAAKVISRSDSKKSAGSIEQLIYQNEPAIPAHNEQLITHIFINNDD